MEVVFNEEDLRNYMTHAVKVSNDSPVLLDRFLDVAIEVDVDACCDGEDVLIGGIMEHVEQAGVHSGDSGCSLPPNSLTPEIQAELREQTRKLAKALIVIGLMNIQFAIQNGIIYVLEVNPRASRTAPFVSKATGVPLAKIGARVMTGKKMKTMENVTEVIPPYFSVKEAVFPFTKFPEADPILGPEMKSTGEVMGTGRTFGEAYAKAQAASGRHAAAHRAWCSSACVSATSPAPWCWRGSWWRRASRSPPPTARRGRSPTPACPASVPTRCARGGRTSST